MRIKLTRASQRDEHTLAGAYAMDSISAKDRERFERHLAGCEECAQEIASLREAIARLGAATAATPPAGLKERVMAAAATTRQQPPVDETEPVPLARGTWAIAGTWLRSLAWPGRLTLAAGATAAAAARTRSFRPAGRGSAAPVPSMAVASRRLATSRAHSSHPARCRSNRSRSGTEIASIAYAPASV